MATYQTRNGRVRAIIRRQGMAPLSKTHDTLTQAKQWAREEEAELDSGGHTLTPKQRKTTVKELFERYCKEVTPTHGGWRWEENRIGNLIKRAHFVDCTLKDFDSDRIREWRDKRLTEVSPPSVNREMNLISAIFSHAIKEWGVKLRVNPVSLVSRPKNANRRRTKRWLAPDVEKMLEATGFDENQRPRLAYHYVPWTILLAIETAMRKSELCGFKVQDVNLAERHIMLHKTKNGDPRQVPLSRRAEALVVKLMAGKRPGDHVIPVHPETLGVYFRKYRKVAGLDSLHFHDTRHEAATRLSKKLSNVLELSAVTGHRDLKSLQIYYNPTALELASKLD